MDYKWKIPDEIKNSKYKFFAVDTSAVMNNPGGIKKLVEYCNETGKKVLILSSVFDELDNISKRGGHRGYNARLARDVLQSLNVQPSYVYVDMAEYAKSDKCNINTLIGGKCKNKNVKWVAWSGKRIKNDGHLYVDGLLEYLAYEYPVAVITNDSRILNSIYMKHFGGGKGYAYEFDGNGDEIYKGFETVDFDLRNMSPPDRLKLIEDKLGKHIYPNEIIFSDSETFINKDGGIKKILLNEISRHFTPNFKPRNEEQLAALKLLLDPGVKLVFLYGPAGTGKTFLSLISGLYQWKEFFQDEKYDSIIAMIGTYTVGDEKDIGALPGNKRKKMAPWAEKLSDNLKIIKKIAKKELKNFDARTKKIDISPSIYMRGRTITDTFILVEEAQNFPQITMKTILTRVGDGSKIVIVGDPNQIDNKYLSKTTNGIAISIRGMMGHKEEDFPPYMGVLKLRENVRSEISRDAAERL